MAYKVLARKDTKVVIISGTSSPSDYRLCSAAKENLGGLRPNKIIARFKQLATAAGGSGSTETNAYHDMTSASVVRERVAEVVEWRQQYN